MNFGMPRKRYKKIARLIERALRSLKTPSLILVCSMFALATTLYGAPTEIEPKLRDPFSKLGIQLNTPDLLPKSEQGLETEENIRQVCCADYDFALNSNTECLQLPHWSFTKSIFCQPETQGGKS